MSKKIDELLPSDKVMIEFGPKTQKNNNTGEIDTVEKTKTLDLPYGFFLTATEEGDGYNEMTGYVKTMGRTLKLLGMADYEDHVTDRGETIKVPVVVEFATDASRAKAKADAEKQIAEQKKAAEEAEKKRVADEKAEIEFQKKADAKRQADADKKAKEDAKIEADKQVAAVIADNAKGSFEHNQDADALAEQEKRLVAEIAAQNAANKPA